MPTRQGFPFAFDPLRTLARLESSSDQLIGTPARRQIYEAALAELLPLLEPAIAYKVYPVRGRQDGWLSVASGQLLHSRVAADLFGDAPEVVAMVYTIGPRVEARIEALQAEGEYAVGYTLDALGTLALGEVGYVACQEIDRLAAAKGVRASIPLNPGTTHWPASDQPVVIALAGGAVIGVSVTESFLLRPFKTNSMVIALGADVLTPDRGSSCDYCENSELCGQRRRPAHAE